MPTMLYFSSKRFDKEGFEAYVDFLSRISPTIEARFDVINIINNGNAKQYNE